MALRGNKKIMENLITSINNDFNYLEGFNYKFQEKYSKIDEEEIIIDAYQEEMHILY